MKILLFAITLFLAPVLGANDSLQAKEPGCPAGPYVYFAEITSVYDGDTVRANIDLGFNVVMTDRRIRILRINAPELRGKEKPKGIDSRDFLRSFLGFNKAKSVKVLVQSRGYDPVDNFGRVLAEIYTLPDCSNISDTLVEYGMAEYMEY